MVKTLMFSAACVVVFALHSSGAGADKGLIFRARFEGSLAAESRRGRAEVQAVEGEAQYRPGRFGQALLCGDGGTRVAYPLADHLDPEFGTVAMWISPVNWRPSDRKMHIFIEAGQPSAGWLLFYKYYQGAKLLFRPQNDLLQASYPETPPLKWRTGEWHHIAATWLDGRLQLFVDGELVHTITETFLPDNLGDCFWIGDAGMGDVHKLLGAQTLVDDLRIYDRPLSPEAIARLARQWTLRVSSEPRKRRWLAEVDVPWLADDHSTPKAVIELIPDDDGKALFHGEIRTWHDGVGVLPIDSSVCAPGSFTVSATLEGTQKRQVVHKHEPQMLVLENKLVRLAFDAATGGLVGLHNKATGQVCRTVEHSSPVFELRVVDYERHSRFFSKDDWQVLRPSVTSRRRCEIERLSDTRRLVVEHSFAPNILVQYTVSLRPDSPLSEWRITVKNRAPLLPSNALLVHQAAFPIVDGLRLGDDPSRMGLALPRYQGQYYRDPLQNAPLLNTLHYLGTASMSWMDLHDSTGGLYLASYDTALPQTELIAEVTRERTSMTLSIRRWTFLWPDETWQGGPCVLGLHPGDWHWGADRYREYFARSFTRTPTPEWVQQADGWLGMGGPKYTFKELPALFDVARYIGLDYLQLWSEMTGGDETYHVYLYPNPFMGEVADLKMALAEIHRRGGHVGFYHNYVTTDPTLDRYLARTKYAERVPAAEPKPFKWGDGWMNVALKDFTGQYRHLPAGQGYYDGYWAACPAAREWQDYSVYWIVERWAKEFGADAWYLDSVPPGYSGYARTSVCWNVTHGHHRPQGVNDGVLEVMRRIRNGAEKIRPFGLLNEGVCDFFYQHTTHALGTDLAGWSKPPKPEIFAYTFPDFLVFSGSCNRIQGTAVYYEDMTPEEVTHEDALRRVHLMGLRYDILPRYGNEGLWPFDPEKPFVEWLKKLIGLRQRIKGHLYASDFRDTLGLGPLPAKVEAKLFRHRERRSLTITLLDRRQDQKQFELGIDAATCGIRKIGVTTLHKLEGSAELRPGQSGGTIRVKIPPLGSQVGALIIETP